MLKASQSTPAGRNLSATSQNIRLGLGCIAGSPHLHGVDTAKQSVSGSAIGRDQWIGGYVLSQRPPYGGDQVPRLQGFGFRFFCRNLFRFYIFTRGAFCLT